MKPALLLLAFSALPLAAWAGPLENRDSPTEPTVARQFAEAAADCTAGGVTPADARWGSCVNTYLQYHYKYQLIPIAHHWLAMVRAVSQSHAFMLVLPVALPATATSWVLPVRYSGVVYREGNDWCAGLNLDDSHRCA